MYPKSCRALPLLWILGLALSARPALAQDVATAEALFNSGLADMEANRYATGCKALAESLRLDPRPGTLFTLAACEERWGHVASAMSRYSDYLDLFERLGDDRKATQGERPKVARAARDRLRTEVAWLTLAPPPNMPPGSVVKRDGQVLGEAALGIELPVDPGDHAVSTELPGGGVWEQRISLSKGEKKTLSLETRTGTKLESPPGPIATPQEPLAEGGESPRPKRLAGFVVGGIGVGGLVAGGVLGGLAVAKKATVGQNCGSSIGQTSATACNAKGLDAVSAGRGLALGSTIGLAVGLAATITGVVLVATDHKPARAAGASQRWIAMGTLSAGPAGAVGGIQGSW